MIRYKLRTLLIILAVGPPLIAAGWWVSKTDDELVHTAVAIAALVVGFWLLAKVLAYLP